MTKCPDCGEKARSAWAVLKHGRLISVFFCKQCEAKFETLMRWKERPPLRGTNVFS